MIQPLLIITQNLKNNEVNRFSFWAPHMYYYYVMPLTDCATLKMEPAMGPKRQ